MEDKNKPINPMDQQLRQLVDWMIDNITIRELLKSLIEDKEKKEKVWLDKIEIEVQIKGR